MWSMGDPIRRAMAEHGLIGCRLHGPSCTAPPGWDREHSDSDRPYTVDELAARTQGPHFGAYDSYEDYMAGWALWKALLRDSRLSPQERAVVQPMRDERLRERLMAVVDGAPEHWREAVRQALVDEPHKFDQLGWFTLDRLPEPAHSQLRPTLALFAGPVRGLLRE